MNVSQSVSFFSEDPQIAVDSAGTAHIVWTEEDDDYSIDTEVLYSYCDSMGCEPPVSLSGPPNWKCGYYTYILGDAKSEFATISIQSDQVMVVWRAYEPVQLTQPYSTWQVGGTPPLKPTGCAPMGGNISDDQNIGHHRVAGGGGGFGLVFISAINGTEEIYYSQYTSNTWSAPILIGTDAVPDIYLDSTAQAHVTLCIGSGYFLKYWNSVSQTLEELPATCYGDAPVVADTQGGAHVIWEDLTAKVYTSKRLAEGWSEPELVNYVNGLQNKPDATIDDKGDVHVVWQDTRDGNSEIYYSYSYTCKDENDEDILPASEAGQAVLASLKNSNVQSLNYCKNNVVNVIHVSPENPSEEAFSQWADLLKSANNEVAFTTMLWDEGTGSATIIQGINELYALVKDDSNLYPRGMTIRILLGVQRPSTLWSLDQRHIVLTELRNQQVPIYETISEGRIWKVEVAVYRKGMEAAAPIGGNQSHVKLMVVDNKEMIVSGYNLQNGVFEKKVTDLGLRVSGPIAANGMMVFDSLWTGSKIDLLGKM